MCPINSIFFLPYRRREQFLVSLTGLGLSGGPGRPLHQHVTSPGRKNPSRWVMLSTLEQIHAIDQ